MGCNTQDAGHQGVVTDAFGSLLELVLEEGMLLFDDEVVFPSISSQERVVTDAANQGLALTGHDLGVSEEEWIWMLLVIVWLSIWISFIEFVLRISKADRVLLPSFGLSREVHALVHGDVHFLQKDAVSRHSVTLLDIDNITDHQLSNWNRLARPEGTSIHRDSLVINLILQLEVLMLFDPITCSSNKCSEEKTTVDGQRLDISVFFVTKYRKD